MRLRPWLGRTLLRLARWRVTGTLRAPGVFVGAPHTSNWDFVLAVLVLWSFGIRPRALVKREAFVGPLAPVLRSLGAVPTERRATTGLPLTFCWVDGPTRTVGLAEPMLLTGDVGADMTKVRAIFAHARGVRPGKVTVPRLRAEDEAPGDGGTGTAPDGDATAT